jgi:hypothetical protein
MSEPIHIELHLHDGTAAELNQAADALERLRTRLSPWLLTKILDAFERIVETVKSEGGSLEVVIRDSGIGAAGTVKQIAEVHFPERLLELLAAVCALDGEIERVCQAHWFLLAPSSPTAGEDHSCTDATANPLSDEVRP